MADKAVAGATEEAETTEAGGLTAEPLCCAMGVEPEFADAERPESVSRSGASAPNARRLRADSAVPGPSRGRSNANCWATDLFFARGENWETDWAERDLPESIHDVLAMMGEALHDTVQAPDIARNFGCLPEQLFERVRQLPD